MNPLVLAGITLVIGLGMGWAIGHTTGSSAAKAAGAGHSAASGGGGHSGLNSGAATGEGPGSGAGDAAGAGAPVQVAEKKVFTAEADVLFKKLIADLESGEELSPMELATRIQQLKDMGEEGIRVMADFLKSNEDIELSQEGRGMRQPTLRMALLQALDGVNSETAKEASLYVMKSSPYISEVAMAARNLEGSWPGEYSEQLNQQMKSLITALGTNTDLTEDQMRREGFMALQYISRYGATDLLPVIEGRLATASDRELGGYLWQLNNMSPEAQADSLARLASNPATAAKLVENGGQLARLDLSSTTSQETVTGLYQQMPADEQEEFLESFRGGRRGDGGGGRRGGGGWNIFGGSGTETTTEQRIASTEGSLKVLGGITPTTPVQQQLHGEAIQNLNNRLQSLKNPEPTTN